MKIDLKSPGLIILCVLLGLPLMFSCSSPSIEESKGIKTVQVKDLQPSPSPSLQSLAPSPPPEVSPSNKSLSIDELMKSGQIPEEKTTYSIPEEIEDSSTGTAKRFSRRIVIPLGRTREEVRETLKRASRDLLGQREVDAAMIFGYRPNESREGSYSVGRAVIAPGGDWSKASSGEQKRVSIELVESYFK
jgi:hypothetical protein